MVKVAFCGKCGTELEMDSDGGYCSVCEEYFPLDIIDDWRDEEENY